MKPYVSVVVATYRREKELQVALASLAQQTYECVEIVVVDDNAQREWNEKVSTVVSQIQRNYPHINLNYIVNESNQGSAKTRNIGIDQSIGEYITFLDDDDVYFPNKVENQVAFMEEGELDYSVTDINLYDENDKLIDRRSRGYIKDTSKQSLIKYHLKYHITSPDTMMFRKSYLVGIGKFAPIDVGDDYYLMQRAIEGDGKFGYLPSSDVKAYVHTGEGGLSSGDGKIKGENALYEYKKAYFDQLTSKDIRYIKVRHYAVIAYADVRRRRYLGFALNAMKSFIISPIDFFSLLKK